MEELNFFGVKVKDPLRNKNYEQRYKSTQGLGTAMPVITKISNQELEGKLTAAGEKIKELESIIKLEREKHLLTVDRLKGYLDESNRKLKLFASKVQIYEADVSRKKQNEDQEKEELLMKLNTSKNLNRKLQLDLQESQMGFLPMKDLKQVNVLKEKLAKFRQESIGNISMDTRSTIVQYLDELDTKRFSKNVDERLDDQNFKFQDLSNDELARELLHICRNSTAVLPEVKEEKTMRKSLKRRLLEYRPNLTDLKAKRLKHFGS